MEWISVKDRLPDCNIKKSEKYTVSEKVLTYGSDGIEIHHLLNGEWWASITHWMPIPTPPPSIQLEDAKESE